MARLITISAVAAIVALCFPSSAEASGAFPRHHQLQSLSYNFDAYVRDANRQYVRGSEEWQRRERIFNKKLAEIKAHNADPSRTWKRGVNQFTDWTEEEFKNYNRARVPSDNEPSIIPKKIHEPAANIGTLPKFVDYRTRVNPPILTGIKNQGSCGSCWAHSATEQMESYFALRYGQLPVLSTQQVTACTASEDGCGGGSYVAGWEFVQVKGGLAEEWTYPYTDFFAPAMEKQFTSKCQNISEKFPVIHPSGGQPFLFTWWPKANVSAWTQVPRNDGHAVVEVLAQTGPLAITVASDQWSDYESGVLQNNYSTAATNATWQSLNHDVQLVGYGFDFDLNVGYWVVRNSWGTNYGEEGYIRLWRPTGGEKEPCGDAFGYEICGTSGLLYNPGYVEVKPLEKQNGYYF